MKSCRNHILLVLAVMAVGPAVASADDEDDVDRHMDQCLNDSDCEDRCGYDYLDDEYFRCYCCHDDDFGYFCCTEWVEDSWIEDK